MGIILIRLRQGRHNFHRKLIKVINKGGHIRNEHFSFCIYWNPYFGYGSIPINIEIGIEWNWKARILVLIC